MPNQLQSLDKQAQLLGEVQRAFEEFDAARARLGEALLRLNKGQRIEILSEILTSISDWRKTIDERERAEHLDLDDEGPPGPTRTILRVLKANPNGMTRKQVIKECSLVNINTTTGNLDALVTAILSQLRKKKRVYRDEQNRYFLKKSGPPSSHGTQPHPKDRG